jgi:hypothetical protein
MEALQLQRQEYGPPRMPGQCMEYQGMSSTFVSGAAG